MPADHPSREGHFAGRPLVPAVVLIEALAGDYVRHSGQVARVLRHFRMTGPLAFGSPMQVAWAPRDGGCWQVEGRVDKGTGENVEEGVAGETACKASFGPGDGQLAAEPDGVWPDGAASIPLQPAGPLYRALPYAGAMRLLEALGVGPGGQYVVGTGLLQPDHPLAGGEGFPGWAALEYAAQLLACLGVQQVSGDGAFGNAAPGNSAYGYRLARVRHLLCHRPPFRPKGQVLQVRVDIQARQPQAVSARFIACCEKEPLASGDFTVVRL
ncbi:MAG: hypothetical protein ACK5HY_08185 [Parahaliea sp.]